MAPIDANALVAFVVDEARLLDEARYDEWLALFAEDAHYWVPLHGAAQRDAHQAASIAYEDRLLLSLRIERLKSPRAHSQQPRSRSQHVLQTPRVEHADHAAGQYRLRTPFLYVEARGEQRTLLAGTWRHRLVRAADGGLRIAEKRVDLVDAPAAHAAIQLFP